MWGRNKGSNEPYGHKLLSGRLILAKSILEGLLVYWMSLFKLPCAILDGMRKRISSFIWSGIGGDDKYHLASWEAICKPKQLGGWGLCNLPLFNKALHLKSLWRGLLWTTSGAIFYMESILRTSKWRTGFVGGPVEMATFCHLERISGIDSQSYS